MQLRILRELRGIRALSLTDGTIYAASGTHLYRLSGTLTTQSAQPTPVSVFEKLVAAPRLFRHSFRLGVHHLCQLQDGAALLVLRRRVFRCDRDGHVDLVMRISRGNKPAHRGVCVTPNGTVLLGEYALNGERKLPVVLHRSVDHGRSFQPVFVLEPGRARHIHFVQWDPIARRLWLGTGDSDHECSIYESVDDGMSWTLRGGGSQVWRAVGVAFRADAVYWGTDAGSDTGRHPNHVIRFDRASGALDRVWELQGPCHGSATLADGTLLISTGVEGGENERDHLAHLWASRDGHSWQEVFALAKDCYPNIVQFGVLRFPMGLERSTQVIFTALGLRGAGEKVFIGELVD